MKTIKNVGIIFIVMLMVFVFIGTSITTVEAATKKKVYTEKEAIKIYEAGLRKAGFRKPEEVYPANLIKMFSKTAGMSWGINEIPLKNPEAAVASSVRGFKGQGFNLYYIKNLGVKNGCVRLKVYYG